MASAKNSSLLRCLFAIAFLTAGNVYGWRLVKLPLSEGLGIDGLGEAFQPIDTGNAHLLHAAVLQYGWPS